MSVTATTAPVSSRQFLHIEEEGFKAPETVDSFCKSAAAGVDSKQGTARGLYKLAGGAEPSTKSAKDWPKTWTTIAGFALAASLIPGAVFAMGHFSIFASWTVPMMAIAMWSGLGLVVIAALSGAFALIAANMKGNSTTTPPPGDAHKQGSKA